MRRPRRGIAAREECWWERWPELYEAEVRAYAKYDATPKVVFKRYGYLIIVADFLLTNGDLVQVRIAYSPFHPFCRPVVSSPDRDFGRHQDPIDKTLCLIPQRPGAWNPRQLVADFVKERLEQLVEAVTARQEERWDDAAQLEEHAPDPLMSYYAGDTELSSVVLYDGTLPLPASPCGIARFSARGRPHRKNPAAFQAVLEKVDSIGTINLRPPFRLPEHAFSGEPIVGRWVRLAPPPTSDPQLLLDAAERAIAAAGALDVQVARAMAKTADAEILITALLFPDEVEYGKMEQGIGAVFLVSRKEGHRRRVSIVKCEAVSGELFERLPVATALREKSVMVIGCGAIGSFVATDLARAGIGRLLIIDPDDVKPGNSIRWLLGLPAWGVKKADALHTFIGSNYPFTHITRIEGKIGGTTDDVTLLEKNASNALEVIRSELGNHDLIIDATGSSEAQQALAFHCRDLSVSYLVGYATLGVAGGMVAYFPPRSEACFVCLNEDWIDGTLPPLKEDKTGVVTPVGCNSDTFTGGSFDLQEISLQLVRSAVAILTGADSDKAILAQLSLQDEDGRRILPHWSLQEIPANPGCTAHSA